MGILDFIRNHFLHALPILLSGAIGLAIMIERVYALFYRYPFKNTESFFQSIKDSVTRGDLNQALSLCEAHPEKPAAKIAKTALLRAHQPETLVEHGLELAVGEASHSIQKRTSFLSTIANVATLLGLFGTIVGLIHSFEAVAHADAQQKSALLAAGISTAMNATMLGLGVAIPCMVAFSFLINRSNRLSAEMDQSAIQMMDILKQRFYGSTDDDQNKAA